jgi:hypothetical protein
MPPLSTAGARRCRFTAMTAPSTPAACPNCGAAATGRFCSNCGASVAGGLCAGCNASLVPGAKYCHRCGMPVGASLGPRGGAPRAAQLPPQASDVTATPGSWGSALPWAVAAIALVALVALVAGQRFSGRADQVAAAPVAADEGPSATGPGVGRAPDISAMSPTERAERLFNRVMSYSERGRADSAQFFAPMAMAAYQMIGPLTPDQRYDMGRVAAVVGDVQVVTAQADTVLAQHPHHLLGLILAAQGARMRSDGARARQYLDRLAAAEPAERAKQLPEYDQHRTDIAAALAEARRK